MVNQRRRMVSRPKKKVRKNLENTLHFFVNGELVTSNFNLTNLGSDPMAACLTIPCTDSESVTLETIEAHIVAFTQASHTGPDSPVGTSGMRLWMIATSPSATFTNGAITNGVIEDGLETAFDEPFRVLGHTPWVEPKLEITEFLSLPPTSSGMLTAASLKMKYTFPKGVVSLINKHLVNKSPSAIDETAPKLWVIQEAHGGENIYSNLNLDVRFNRRNATLRF